METDALIATYVEFYRPLCLLICTRCHTTLKPGKSIEKHFRKNHKLKGKELKDLLQHCFSFSPADPDDIPLPDDFSSRIPYLQVYKGFICGTCYFKTVDNSNIYRHFTSFPDCKKETDAFYPVELQSFFQNNRQKRYWAVYSSNPRFNLLRGK